MDKWAKLRMKLNDAIKFAQDNAPEGPYLPLIVRLIQGIDVTGPMSALDADMPYRLAIVLQEGDLENLLLPESEVKDQSVEQMAGTITAWLEDLIKRGLNV